MITEQYVSFETAKLLKEKGFDEECNSFYRKSFKNNKIVNEPNLYISTWFKNNSGLKESGYSDIVYCSAPTQSLVIRWLREVCNILISIEVYCIIESPIWCYKYYNLHKDYIKISSQYKSYEDACEAAIKYYLKNLI